MQTLPAHYRQRSPLPPRHKRPRYILRRLLALVAVVCAIAVLFLSFSLYGAWRTPGNENFQAKWADWLRSHHAASLANTVEQYYYDHHQPPKGGAPAHLNAVPPPFKHLSPVRHIGLPPPAAVSLVVSPPLLGEGRWAPAGVSVQGVPAMYVAQFRADNVYTSQITSAVWIDPTLLRVALVPGAREPGGTWSESPDINGTALSKVVAAFNGGFRMQDAHGGFYLDGRQPVPLRPGAASFVLYNDGRVNIGTWGTQVTMTPPVTAVLQNLVLIVDHGQTAPAATYGDSSIWGATLNAATVVPRSGIGVTSTGALVYVAGPALTARSLAESLMRAGAVRAMCLDINPEWVTFNFYSRPNAAAPTQIEASKLYPQMQRPATRYLGPTPESRDFFTVSLY
jgi:Phosphodiester glycosidase